MERKENVDHLVEEDFLEQMDHLDLRVCNNLEDLQKCMTILYSRCSDSNIKVFISEQDFLIFLIKSILKI